MQKKVILLVGGLATAGRLALELIKRGYVVERADHGAAARERLDRKRSDYDVVAITTDLSQEESLELAAVIGKDKDELLGSERWWASVIVLCDRAPCPIHITSAVIVPNNIGALASALSEVCSA